MAEPFTLLLVHHSHTDVGYTESPARIERWQVDFLRQALAILDERPGFRWVAETFWAVECFLARADATERAALAREVHRGRIGLSASYLNLSELLDARVLGAVTARAARQAQALGVDVRCALTADVNGFGWGFAGALLDARVEALFTCVHTHHGRYPLDRPQRPFLWETPDGRRLRVWSGEHYHFGNELGLVPGANSSYLIKDECDAATIFGDHRRVAETRIRRYVDALLAQGHAYDFAPVMASGLRTDNAPPNPAILDAVAWWNDAHGEEVRVEMATLEDVLERWKRADDDLPVYRGDWPDWWSDGPASRPAGVRLFRQAQRDLDRLRALEAHAHLDPAPTVEIETALALFAEHTFSHSDAMAQPWLPLVAEIDASKDAHAARAAALVTGALDDVRERLGGASLRPDLPLRWRVLNPYDVPIEGLAHLEVGHHEFEELGLGAGFHALDARTGEHLPVDLVAVPRGAAFLVPVHLAPGQERILQVVPEANGRGTLTWALARGSGVETPTLGLAWAAPNGIVRLDDVATGRSLLRAGAPHAAFQPVHEATPVADPSEVCAVRGRMGLDRRGPDALCADAFLGHDVRTATGEVVTDLALPVELEGTRFGELRLRLDRHARRLDAALRLHKESLWAPESLYVALPFAAGPDAAVVLDKAGARVRPPAEQIPGTLTDFHAVQAGWISLAEGFGVAVGMPDQHLLQLGPLAAGERRLAGDPALASDPRWPYAWVMNNVWETNFAANLGGFHEHRFMLLWGEDLGDADEAARRLRAALSGPEVIRLRAGGA